MISVASSQVARTKPPLPRALVKLARASGSDWIAAQAATGDMLRRFMIALRKGAADVAADPQAGVEAIMTARPESNRDVLTAEIAAVPGYLHTAASAGKPYGWLAPADIAEMLTVQRTYYDLPESVTAEQIYTGQFAE